MPSVVATVLVLLESSSFAARAARTRAVTIRADTSHGSRRMTAAGMTQLEKRGGQG